jgi:uncharacterized protein YdaT
MSTPNGWTKKETKHRDVIAKALVNNGYTESQAFAIATAQITKLRRGINK